MLLALNDIGINGLLKIRGRSIVLQYLLFGGGCKGDNLQKHCSEQGLAHIAYSDIGFIRRNLRSAETNQRLMVDILLRARF